MRCTVQRQAVDDIYWIADENNHTVADLYFKQGTGAYFKFPDAEKNAHILAASFEMLESMESLINATSGLEHDNALKAVKAAISKARGES